MAENNERNFDNRNLNEPEQQSPNRERAVGAAAGASPNQTEAQQMKAQRGGVQEDQIVGETSEGAHNQRRQNRNPSGNDPEHNAEGEGNF
jgi:hypothetical protein